LVNKTREKQKLAKIPKSTEIQHHQKKMGNRGGELGILKDFLEISAPKEDISEPQAVETENGDNEQQTNDGKNAKKWGKKARKGRNKDRPAPQKFTREDKLCPTLNQITEESSEDAVKCTYPNCAFQHDPVKYMESKPEDIAEDCPVFKLYGHCEKGLACRFAKAHIKDNKYNVINKDVYKDGRNARSLEKNHLNKDIKDKLRKKQYDFTATDKIVDQVFKDREQAQKDKEAVVASVADKEPEPKKIKVIEGKIEVAEKRIKIDWKDKLYLAPLTTVGNLPFRRVCKKYGADITCGEMAMTTQLLQGHLPEWALVQRHECEDIFGIQLCGCHPHQFSRVATLVEDGHIDADFIDLNLGCPIDIVYQRGMGSGFMGRKKPLEVTVKSMSAIMTRPLTVKIRTGIYMDKRLAHNLAPNFRDWGADMVTLHGRSREQRYTKMADWDYIGEVAKVVTPMPLFGNGDINNFEDYNEYKEKSGTSGCMLARGALIKPWVFTEIKEQRHWDISANERLDMVKDYAYYGLEHWGSDDKGVETTRRFLLEWLSFLYRYVPVGILEKPPQRMNEWVPKHHGRNNLETIMSSPDSNDWVKITEMFLGKVPDNFDFLPKHRAHGYK
jgi:tRNA-dihydrouridine synthase 3